MARQNVVAAAVLGALNSAIVEAANSPEVPVPTGRGAEVARAVERRVLQRVSADPVVQHATNTEIWYRSRVTIGALVTLISGLAGLVGVAVEPEDAALLTNGILAVGAMVGAVITLYGRWRARTPLGA